MNERDFFYWLQGFFELSDTEKLSRKQVQIIKDHMALVATKLTPSYPSDSSDWFESDDLQVDVLPFLTCGYLPKDLSVSTYSFDMDDSEDIEIEVTMPCGDKGCTCNPEKHDTCNPYCTTCYSHVKTPVSC